ncbi:MFS transporter [Polycyclovorans algicola]|uniref:MFS transporter n=1 Tax=Polycyclovorans algicola TaxID=616992 RepID=UPI0004A6F465|nr:MFS transporter [Polycyclovorans algicola]
MMDPSQFRLLGKRRFGPYFLTQALSAFTDNVYRSALVVLLAFGGAGLSPGQIDLYANVAAALFILPFFLFSATAGQIADKYEKSTLIRWIKLFELGVVVLAVIGFMEGSMTMLLALLFLMGTQSALFGPVKYSILPHCLRRAELVGGNALVAVVTFLAILLGTMLGGWLVVQGSGPHWVAATVMALAVLGYAASFGIPRGVAAAPDLRINWNPLAETWRNFQFVRGNRTVMLAVLGISWFWCFGAVFLSQLPNYSRVHLGGDVVVMTLLLGVFSLGMGVGALLCERLSGGKLEMGLVPLGSIGLTWFGIDLYFAMPEAVVEAGITVETFFRSIANHRMLWDLGLMGLFGGLYIVPLYALIQTRTDPQHLSRVIAGNNILNAAFMVGAAVMSIVLLQWLGLSIPQLLLLTVLVNAAVAIFIYSLVPEFVMRFLVWIIINTLYRIRKTRLDHIPDEGPAVIVCNHVSFVDAVILGGNIRRPVRFVMYHKIYNVPVLNFIFRTAKAIPIAGAKEDPVLMARAFAEIEVELKAGNVVCIFPEGGLTMDGEIQPFRAGIERIIKATPVPVIPMALQGLWGSFFSRRDSALKRARLPRRVWSAIGLVAGEPVPPEKVSAADLQRRVQALRGDLA